MRCAVYLQGRIARVGFAKRVQRHLRSECDARLSTESFFAKQNLELTAKNETAENSVGRVTTLRNEAVVDHWKPLVRAAFQNFHYGRHLLDGPHNNNRRAHDLLRLYVVTERWWSPRQHRQSRQLNVHVVNTLNEQ
jgi:hypothetical protein